MERLAADSELAAYKHHGFWQPMDTLREKNYLEALWESGKAPWKVWGMNKALITGINGQDGLFVEFLLE